MKANFRNKGPDNPPLAIVYGFSSAMLGITGFETTANFVEQQKKGVFAKTLRNMIWLVSVPCLSRAVPRVAASGPRSVVVRC